MVLYVNLDSLLSTWSRQVQIIVYLKDDLKNPQRKTLEALFAKNPQISSVEYVSRQAAWENFKNTFSAETEFLQSLDFNPLPASYNLRFKPGPNRVENIRLFAETLGKKSEVESLEYGEKWISRFEKFMIFLRVFLLAVGGLLSLGLIFIISNTIKLSALARKNEIELMLMIGATHRYIKTPFLLEGALQGAAGAVLALLAAKGVHGYMSFQFSDSIAKIARDADFLFIGPSGILILFGVSVAVGWLGSYISINKVLNMENGS